ncbi:conserved hypothetical protein [Gammaproteobacteria bacterium]
MPNRTYVIENQELKFVSGIRIGIDYPLTSDFIVMYCNQRKPAEWHPLNYRKSRGGNYLDLRFTHHTNAAHFKIDIIGQQQEPARGELIYFIPPSLQEAKNNLASKKIVFLGCVRNCETSIRSSIEKLMELGALFDDFEIHIFENDSTDNSREILNELSRQGRFKILSRSGLDELFPLRTQRLAFCRNLLWDEVCINSTRPDYVCVVDMDGVIEGLPTIQGFLSSFRFEACWDAVFPVNNGSYYDVYALRHPLICDGDYHRKFTHFDASFGMRNALWFTLQNIGSMNFSSLPGWLEVKSAFGGMAIYKFDGLDQAHYVGIDNGIETCEHVALHSDLLRIGKRLFINPEFIIETHKVP